MTKNLPASAPKNGHYKAYILGPGKDGIAKTLEWGGRKLPVSRRIALLSWREKSAALNPPIFAGGPQRQG